MAADPGEVCSGPNGTCRGVVLCGNAPAAPAARLLPAANSRCVRRGNARYRLAPFGREPVHVNGVHGLLMGRSGQVNAVPARFRESVATGAPPPGDTPNPRGPLRRQPVAGAEPGAPISANTAICTKMRTTQPITHTPTARQVLV